MDGGIWVWELEQTINATPCVLVIIGTPVDLSRLLNIIKHPRQRVTDELQEIGQPTLAEFLSERLD